MWRKSPIYDRRVKIAALGAFLALAGCGAEPLLLLPDESTDPIDSERFELLARFAHISDAQLVDEESPARLTAFAHLSASAWRPQEVYSLHLLDGMVRTVNKIHVARAPVDFLIHTGDAADNAQLNETQWFVDILDGGIIDPLTGPDDRGPDQIPHPPLDAHRPFAAQGLYRNGVHGEAATIPWYALLGNHDRFAVGVFPIVTDLFGRRTSPLPLPNRIGLFAPVVLDPTGRVAWGAITPAHPGPPPQVVTPQVIVANPMRRFATVEDFVELHATTFSEPAGHGFDPQAPNRTWYSTALRPGLRLIGLNSSDPPLELPRQAYSEGALSLAQVAFLKEELAAAQRRGEVVLVATHHPSDAIQVGNGSAVSSRSLRDTLRNYPCVVLHLVGHWHRGAVIDRRGYLEVVTSSVIDPPHEGRVIEIWKPIDADGSEDNQTIELRYWSFSPLENVEPRDDSDAFLFEDPLRAIREVAVSIASGGRIAPDRP